MCVCGEGAFYEELDMNGCQSVKFAIDTDPAGHREGQPCKCFHFLLFSGVQSLS